MTLVKALSNGAVVLALGLFWATGSILGKFALNRGATSVGFPLILNIGTLVVVVMASLHPRYSWRSMEWNRKSLGWQLAVALSLVFLPYLIFFRALDEITPAEASLITSLTPAFSLVIGVVLFKDRVQRSSLLALGSEHRPLPFSSCPT